MNKSKLWSTTKVLIYVMVAAAITELITMITAWKPTVAEWVAVQSIINLLLKVGKDLWTSWGASW